jgi:hypothetical protein
VGRGHGSEEETEDEDEDDEFEDSERPPAGPTLIKVREEYRVGALAPVMKAVIESLFGGGFFTVGGDGDKL